MVEILVAMVIALFMTAALLTLFLNMRRTYSDQDSMAQLQDNERLALTVLMDNVHQAGYFPDPLTNTLLNVMPALNASYATLAAGQTISGSSGAAGASDTLIVQFVTGNNDGVLNCQGQSNTSGANATYVNVFAVSANNELTCAVNGGTAAVLASGVSNFNVLYGVDTDSDGNVDRYLSATAVGAGGYWLKVYTVQVNLAFVNPYAAQPGQPATINWTQTISLMNRT
jgi:type IV pilus assembly protein PilW